MFKKLFPFTQKYRFYMVITPILVMLEVAIEVSLPFIMSLIIDKGINGNGGTAYVVRLGSIMAGMALLSLIFGGLAGRTAAVAGMGFGSNLRNGLFAKVQDFSFSNTDKFPTSSLVTRLTTDVTNTQNAFMIMLRLLVRSPMMLTCATIMALRINTKLSTVFMIAIPVLAIAITILGKAAYPRFMKMLEKYDSLNESVQENLTGIRVVKTFVREDYEIEKFRSSSDGMRQAAIRAQKILISAMPIMMLTVYFCMIAILYLGGGYIIKGVMTTGQLTSFLSYIMQILMSLMMLAMVIIMITMSRASMSRIIEIFDEKIDITDEHANENLILNDGSIVFENVNFKYSDKNEVCVLKDINLTIKSGETVGIIGGTGSSKTSLVQLIPRLYDVNAGEIKVGGYNVKEYKIKTLREGVAMVLQKNTLFSGTIEENLKWGDINASREEIENACKNACAYNFIMDMPEKFDTELGQGGVNVSGGQKQRLCIARALLKKPKIMILDDSTSAVDTATDSAIRKELRKNLKGMTTIIIAQRIASVMDADKIIVLDEGKICAIGTHKELLEKSEIYNEVFSSQQNIGEVKA